jgi:hypothetical protein
MAIPHVDPAPGTEGNFSCDPPPRGIEIKADSKKAG